MPQFIFLCPQDRRVAGCVEAIRVRGPFMRQVPTNEVRMVPQQDGSQVPMWNNMPVQPRSGGTWFIADAAEAWKWVSSQKLPFPQQTNFQCSVEDWYMRVRPDEQYPISDAQATILGIDQTQAPQVQKTSVEAPTMQPTGNPGTPLNAPLTTGIRDNFGFENLSDGALPRTADPMVDVDPEGGTYTDVTVVGGRPVEQERSYQKTYAPKPGA